MTGSLTFLMVAYLNFKLIYQRYNKYFLLPAFWQTKQLLAISLLASSDVVTNSEFVADGQTR